MIDQEIGHKDVEADLQSLTAMTEELGYSPDQRDQLIDEVRQAYVVHRGKELLHAAFEGTVAQGLDTDKET